MSDTQTLLPKELWNERLFNGAWVAGPLTPSDVIEPASGATLGRIGLADGDTVTHSAVAARKAQESWFALPYDERARVLRKVAQLAEQHFDEIVAWIVRESGSTRPKAAFETSLTIKSFYESAGLPSRSQGEVLPTSPGRLSLARRRPLGVIGVISPFNFPLYLAARAVAPALARQYSPAGTDPAPWPMTAAKFCLSTCAGCRAAQRRPPHRSRRRSNEPLNKPCRPTAAMSPPPHKNWGFLERRCTRNCVKQAIRHCWRRSP